MNKLIFLGLGGLVFGCAKQVVSAPQAVAAFENVWSFSANLQVKTQVTGLSGEVVTQFEALGEFESQLEGTVKEGPLRINRDGTESWRLRFQSVRQAEGAVHPLQGHAVETRRFAGGPLLSLQQTEYAASLGQFGALDPIVALLFLTPPEEPLMQGQIAWPFRLDSGRKSHHFSNLFWRRVNSESNTVFHYEGDLSIRAQDRRWQAKAEGAGRLAGEIEVAENGEILVHRFRVERQLDWHFQAQNFDVSQHHVLEGSFRVLSGEVVDPWGQDFYLNEDQVLRGIHSQASAWEACAPTSDWSRPLNFSIETSGRVAPIQALGPCANVLAADVFTAHHHDDFQVKSQIVIQGGKYIPYPTATIPNPETLPAHLVFQLGTEIAGLGQLLQSQN
jgi:hypothetical protein